MRETTQKKIVEVAIWDHYIDIYALHPHDAKLAREMGIDKSAITHYRKHARYKPFYDAVRADLSKRHPKEQTTDLIQKLKTTLTALEERDAAGIATLKDLCERQDLLDALFFSVDQLRKSYPTAYDLAEHEGLIAWDHDLHIEEK